MAHGYHTTCPCPHKIHTQIIARQPSNNHPCEGKALPIPATVGTVKNPQPLNEPWRKESVLPQLWRVLDSAPNSSAPGPSSGASAPGHQSSSTGTGIKRRRAEPGITGKLWDVRKGQSAQLEELLDIVGFVLDSEARLYSSDPPTDFNPSHRAFMFPLVSSRGPLTCPCQARCMPYSVDRIREAQAKPHIGKLIGVSSDYIHLVLAYDGDKHGKIIEYAHRLVLWSIFGPPPQDRWVCMHFCNNK